MNTNLKNILIIMVVIVAAYFVTSPYERCSRDYDETYCKENWNSISKWTNEQRYESLKACNEMWQGSHNSSCKRKTHW